MDDRAPTSLGARLDIVALVCGGAVAIVLATNVVFAMVVDVTVGAAESPLEQRLMRATQPADLTLGVVALVGAAALAVARWLDGEHPRETDALGSLVALAATALTALAVIGLFTDVLWQFAGTPWSWRVAPIGRRAAAVALGGLAVWLGLPPNAPARRWMHRQG